MKLLNLKKEFRIIFIAYLISCIGTFSARLTLAVIVYELTGSKTLLAFSFIVTKLPAFLFGNSLGQLAQKLNAKRTLIWSDIIALVLFAILAFTYQRFSVYYTCIFFFASYALSTLFDAAKSKIISRESETPDQLNYAVATISEIIYISIALGPLVSGFIIDSFNIKTVLLFNALTFLCSLLVLSQLKTQKNDGEKLNLFKNGLSIKKAIGFHSNFNIIKSNELLKSVSVLYFIRCFVYGVFNAIIPVIALIVIQSSATELGKYFFFSCLGSIFGTYVYKRWIKLGGQPKTRLQYSYFLPLTIVESFLIYFCLSSHDLLYFYMFGFFMGIPMILIENRVDYIFLNYAPDLAKSSIKGFQYFVKSFAFTFGIIISMLFVDYVGGKGLPLVLSLILTGSVIVTYLFRYKLNYNEAEIIP